MRSPIFEVKFILPIRLITHSEMKPDGKAKVYIETPDEKDGFHNAQLILEFSKKG